MLTRLRVRNFKNLGEIDIELGQNVVLIGPNNSGKTSALQGLSLWRIGVREWLSRRGEGSTATDRPGVALSRLALTAIPVGDARMLWRDSRVTDTSGRILMTVLVDGQSDEKTWHCGLEFEFSNRETIFCRPMRQGDGPDRNRMPIPQEAGNVRVAFLPPMSGLAAEEAEIQPGRVDVLIGEGQTAQVLRNLCLRVHEYDEARWSEIAQRMKAMFGIQLGQPRRLPDRGSVVLSYEERGHKLDIASAGRGMQQTLLLMAHLYANPGTALLLDEPDAHLEILRQRQTYAMLTDAARATGSQIIAASHSEIVLNEAAEKDTVIAFVGQPHRLVGRTSQLLKSLRDIGFDQYYQASLTGTVLYLEGATDLSILQALARRLNHPAIRVLERPFVHYVGNQPPTAQNHFHGLREACPELRGFALFDRLDRGMPEMFPIVAHSWRRREVENYIADRDTLLNFARGTVDPNDLVELADGTIRVEAMTNALAGLDSAFKFQRRDPWSDDTKVSDEVLPPTFANYYDALGLTDIMAKADYHELIAFKDPATIDPEVTEVLDRLLAAIG